MSTFTWSATYASAVKKAPRILDAQFGDGYAQRAQDGINASPQSWSLVFNGVDDTEADAIEAFLEARGAHEPFDWTPPGKASARFVCKEWNREYSDFQLDNLTMTFTQDFAP